MRLRWRDVGGAVLAVAIAALCVRLGFWQLDRLALRRAANARMVAARARAPLELTGAEARLSPDSARDRRLHVRGVYDYAHERVWPARTWEGTPGVALLTPLRLADGTAVFVDRGFVPSPDAMHVDRAAWREPDSADITGLGQSVPWERGDADTVVLVDSLPYRVRPFVVQLVATGSTTAGRTPYRWPVVAPDNGPHLSYAIQWFSFAVIIVVGTGALLRRQAQEAHAAIERGRPIDGIREPD